jgi:hypothetical protein
MTTQTTADPAQDALEAMRLQHDFRTIWAVEGVGPSDMNKPVPKKLQRCDFVEWREDRVCYLPSTEYTWLDLWKAADNIYRQMDGSDYLFVELFTKKKSDDPGLNYALLDLFLGS